MDKDFEKIAMAVKCKDVKFKWEIVGIYRAPNENLQVIENLTTQTDSLENCMKQSVIESGLNLPCADWSGHSEGTNRGQAFINRLVWKRYSK